MAAYARWMNVEEACPFSVSALLAALAVVAAPVHVVAAHVADAPAAVPLSVVAVAQSGPRENLSGAVLQARLQRQPSPPHRQ